MTRPIEFRGISIDTDKWEYGYLVMDPERSEARIVNRKGNNTMQMNAVYASTVGEFAGFCDKNGKKVFEDDWVLYKGEKWVIKWCIHSVAFRLFQGRNALLIDSFWVISPNGVPQIEDIEIVGSIHDTKP